MNTATQHHKNNVFVTLFSDPARLISLYNALANADFPPTAAVEIITLDNVLYSALRNDIAFVIEGKLVVLIEHQSTINENMPLRLFLYLSWVFEKLLATDDAIYRGKLIKIPRPDFIVLYNGTVPYPDETTLRLSDAFQAPLAPTNLGGQVELSLRVVNINEGRNASTLAKCQALSGYATLVAKVRHNQTQGQDLTAALTNAVKSCIESDILANFLKIHSTEVLNMFNQEFDINIAKRIWEEEARETGHAAGHAAGREEGILSESMRMAKVLLQRNLPLDLIAETTNLPKETLQSLVG